MGGELVRLEGIHHRYGKREALLGVDFLLREGEFVVLMGPNGAGKSTLLKVLGMLLKPSSGKVFFEGMEVTDEGKRKRARGQVVYVSQDPYLFKGTVLDNLLLPLKWRGIKGKEAFRRAEEVLALLDLKGFETRDSKGLSAGERRRVALARALVLNPKVLLLDEPYANLDLSSIMRLEEALGSLIRKGIGVVIATHRHDGASCLQKRLVHLEGGRIVKEEGPIKALS